MTPEQADTLRVRLRELRADVLEQLAEAAPVIDCGLMHVAADAGAILAGLDMSVPVDAESGDRVVLSDDNTTMRLVSYAAADRVAVVEISPRRAVQLASALLMSALPRVR